MKHYDITKPIGLLTPCKEIENTCKMAHIYKRCGLRPKHYIIPLDSGSGRTTFIEYMTDMYKKAGVLSFTSGLDDYLEIVFDGSLQQLRQAFYAVDSAAVYTNEYCNIIGMDISGISNHLGESQFTEFMKNCKRVCEYAYVVFFIHTTPTRNEEKLLNKLCEEIDNIKRLAIEPYTKDDLCGLIIKAIKHHGIEIKHETFFQTILMDYISEFKISNVKDAICTANDLVYFADFSDFKPAIDESTMKSMISSLTKDPERSDVK